MRNNTQRSFPTTWDLIPLAGFLLLGALCALTRNRLPDSIATHFDALGHPNGWTPKTALPWLIFGFPAVLWAFMPLVPHFASPKDPALRPLLRRAMDPLRAFLILGILALLSPTLLPPLPGLNPFWPAMGLFFLCLALGVGGMVLRTQRDLPESYRRNYRWGLFYYNPGDSRLWVEKLLGIGWTLNFARPAAWWILGLLLLLPVGLALAARFGHFFSRF